MISTAFRQLSLLPLCSRRSIDSCQPCYDRIVACKQESRTLAAMRDTLLPKLISGELRVKDAERALTDTPV